MLTSDEAAALLMFLERLQLHAREVDTYVVLRQKLRDAARPPAEAPPASE